MENMTSTDTLTLTELSGLISRTKALKSEALKEAIKLGKSPKGEELLLCAISLGQAEVLMQESLIRKIWVMEVEE